MQATHQIATSDIAQEAAVLFADGRESEAELTLAKALTRPGLPPERSLWLLALDLYRLRGNRRAFQQCLDAMAPEADAPPPPWDPTVDEARLLPEIRAGGTCYVALEGDLDAEGAIALNHHGVLSQCAVVRFDATCLQSLDRQACSVLNDAFQRPQDADIGLYVTGAPRLAYALRTLLTVDSEFKPAWKLLLRLWQLRDDQQEFNRAALEYSLVFGVQPPEWEAAVMPIVALPAVEEKRSEPRYQNGPEVMRPTGTLTGAQDFHLRELQSFAADRKYVNVDLSGVRRLDLAAAEVLVDTANAMIARGKVVRLLRQHGLISELLRLLGLNSAVVCTPLTR